MMRQFMGGRGDSFRTAEFGPHAPVEIAQRRLAAIQGLRRRAEDLGCAAVDFACGCAQYYASADIIGRAQTQP